MDITGVGCVIVMDRQFAKLNQELPIHITWFIWELAIRTWFIWDLAIRTGLISELASRTWFIWELVTRLNINKGNKMWYYFYGDHSFNLNDKSQWNKDF
jgi:hypothetical protein